MLIAQVALYYRLNEGPPSICIPLKKSYVKKVQPGQVQGNPGGAALMRCFDELLRGAFTSLSDTAVSSAS